MQNTLPTSPALLPLKEYDAVFTSESVSTFKYDRKLFGGLSKALVSLVETFRIYLLLTFLVFSGADRFEWRRVVAQYASRDNARKNERRSSAEDTTHEDAVDMVKWVEGDGETLQGGD